MKRATDDSVLSWPVIAAAVGMVALPALGGCAVGNTYRFGGVMAEAHATGSSRLAVATTDQREFVQSGKKSPQFVGLQRGGYGNPFDVTTESGKPLADDVSDAICASLRSRGFEVAPVYVTASLSKAAAQKKLAAVESERAIFVVLDTLKTDTYSNVGFEFDVSLSVFDRNGHLLAQTRAQDDKNLGGSVWNPPAHARRVVPEAFKQMLEELLNHPDVVAALQQ